MNVLLTDRLACPRCGPDFGLILLAHRVQQRRVLDGVWGCSNCRDRFPVTDGFGDLRAPPRGPFPPVTDPPVEPDVDGTFRLAALLGVAEGPGTLVLAGGAAVHGNGLAGRVPGIEVVAVDPRLRWWSEVPGVSRIAAGPGLPLRTFASRGCVLGVEVWPTLLDEGARILARGARLVILEPDDATAGRIAALGLEILARDERALVARRP